MRVVLDIETDGLNPTVIHVVVIKDIDTNEVYTFRTRDELQGFLALHRLTLVVSHNGIAFDWPVLRRLWNVTIDRAIGRDTLVLSRLLDQGRVHGHSLEAWGERLGFSKTEFDQWDRYSEEMLAYCINDVHLNHKLYNFLEWEMRFPKWEKSIKVEHEMAFICREMQDNGFPFNAEKAKELYAEIDKRVQELDTHIQAEFKPIKKVEKEYEIRIKKDGTWGKKYTELFTDPMVELINGKLVKHYYEEFNPQSPRQVIERLDGHWEPTDKTDGHKAYLKLYKKEQDKERLKTFKTYGWKINEVNLATLKDTAPPAAQFLVERIMLGSRLRTLTTWLEACNTQTGRIHGTFNSLGTGTHRLSHTNPNLGNISAEKTIKYKGKELRELATHYGGAFRRLFTAGGYGNLLVGTDMEGAHLRLFAHFIKDQAFIDALVSGNKKLGTDPHSLNAKIIGPLCPDRDLAKTFIFTFLNGGAAPKVGEIFGCDIGTAKQILDGFVAAYPGLQYLKQNQIPKDAKRGYFLGLDGRKVLCDSEHLMISRYLQNGEAVVMKHANVLWQKELRKLQIPFQQVNLVHDEFQTIAYDEDEAHMICKVQSESIRQVGIDLGIMCPLAGESVIGRDWLESH